MIPRVEWKAPPPKDTEGVMVGCTQNYEWLLPWWWVNFRLHNNNPVLFVDFGDMSSKALEWCEKRGTVLKLNISDQFVKKKEEIDPTLVKSWDPDGNQSFFWNARVIWYKKPFALMQTSFEKTIWIDLDCQVNGSLIPLYRSDLQKGEVALVAESNIEQASNLRRGLILPGEKMYNAGVIAYRYGSKLIEEWTKKILEENHLYYADQQLLAHLIAKTPFPVVEMPLLYNWPAHYGSHVHALITHWWGASKDLVSQQIQDLKKSSIIDLTF